MARAGGRAGWGVFGVGVGVGADREEGRDEDEGKEEGKEEEEVEEDSAPPSRSIRCRFRSPP